MHLFCFAFYFPWRSKAEAEEETEVCVGQGMAVRQKKTSLWPNSTLLNELKTKDEKAFLNYTRLPRDLYNEVLQDREEGHLE